MHGQPCKVLGFMKGLTLGLGFKKKGLTLGLGFRVNKKVSLSGTTGDTHHQHTDHMVTVWTLVSGGAVNPVHHHHHHHLLFIEYLFHPYLWMTIIPMLYLLPQPPEQASNVLCY